MATFYNINGKYFPWCGSGPHKTCSPGRRGE